MEAEFIQCHFATMHKSSMFRKKKHHTVSRFVQYVTSKHPPGRVRNPAANVRFALPASGILRHDFRAIVHFHMNSAMYEFYRSKSVHILKRYKKFPAVEHNIPSPN